MKRILLVFIIFLAALLRFWNLNSIPVHLSHDEAAIGYNAYSILETGKDEYGVKFPVLFRSFDDYKLPGYVYLTAASEAVFGLNSFAVRFPSALLGTLTVLAFYLLAKELIGNSRSRLKVPIVNKDFGEGFPFVAAFVFAVSPWHINFSRAAFESNGSLFFIMASVVALLVARRKPYFLIIFAISAVSAIYFYYTARVVLPIILIVYAFVYKDYLFKIKKQLLLAGVVGIILLAPLLPQMFTSGLSRVNQVSIFEDKTYTAVYSEAVVRENNSLVARVFLNRRMAYFHHFTDNYTKNFAPDFLFTNGSGPMGLLYVWEIPFFFLGIIAIAFLKSPLKWIIFAWVLSVPIVGGLTTGQPNALRTLANAPMAALFTGVGLYVIFLTLQRRYFRIGVGVFAILFLFFFLRFLYLYFDFYSYKTAERWQDGHKQMAIYVNENKDNYDKIYISGYSWRPYISYLFYSQYSPEMYQKNGTRDKIENIYFGIADWDRGEGVELSRAHLNELVEKRTLFLLSKSDLDQQLAAIGSEPRQYTLKVKKIIDGRFFKEAFYAVEMQ